jgi:dienelactone hydrolase
MNDSNRNQISLRRRLLWSLAAAACLLFIWFFCTVLLPAWRDPVKFFTARRSETLEASVDTLWHENGLTLKSLRIEGRRNRQRPGTAVSFNAFTCQASGQDTVRPAFVLMGGIRTGRDAIRLISKRPEIAEMGLFITLDYPWDGPRTFKGLQIVPHIPGIRRALFDGVEAVRLAIDYLEEQPGVDPERIVLLGGSVGAFYVVNAGALDHRPAAVVAFMGGGDLGLLFDHNLRHNGYTSSRLISSTAGNFLALLLRPLEPVRLAGAISPTPFIQISATEDERIPEECAVALFNSTEEPHKLIWIPAIHVLPHMDELIEQMMTVARNELIDLGLFD